MFLKKCYTEPQEFAQFFKKDRKKEMKSNSVPKSEG